MPIFGCSTLIFTPPIPTLIPLVDGVVLGAGAESVISTFADIPFDWGVGEGVGAVLLIADC